MCNLVWLGLVWVFDGVNNLGEIAVAKFNEKIERSIKSDGQLNKDMHCKWVKSFPVLSFNFITNIKKTPWVISPFCLCNLWQRNPNCFILKKVFHYKQMWKWGSACSLETFSLSFIPYVSTLKGTGIPLVWHCSPMIRLTALTHLCKRSHCTSLTSLLLPWESGHLLNLH